MGKKEVTQMGEAEQKRLVSINKALDELESIVRNKE